MFTLLMGLLTGKEYDMRYWGLILLGSLCGMNYDFEAMDEKLLECLNFFQKMANIVSLAIWEIVYDLQVIIGLNIIYFLARLECRK